MLTRGKVAFEHAMVRSVLKERRDNIFYNGRCSTERRKSRLVLSDPFRSFPLMGHGLGHGKSGKIQANISSAKAKKSS